jgi:YbbR domain-containing protein
MIKFRELGRQIILALALGVSFWVFVTVTTNPDDRATFNNVPVEARNLPDELVIVGEDGMTLSTDANLEAVSITVETDRETLSQLNQNELDAFVNLADLEAGSHVVPVQVEPNQERIQFFSTQTTPDELLIQLEQVITSTIPLTVEVQGVLPFSYERDEPEVTVGGEDIEEVRVSGPESQVNRVEQAVAIADIDQVRSTTVSTVQLTAQDANGDLVSGVTLSPEQVQVRIDVRSVVGVKRVPVLGNVAGSPALGYVVTGVQSDPALIDIVGSSTLLNRVNHISTEPINIDGATGTITREVRLDFDNVQPQASEPRTATVVVQIAALDQPFQTQVPVPVETVGGPDNLEVTVNPPVLQVALEGSTNAFLQLPIDSLVATVDVSGLAPGTYSLTPTLNLPENIQLVATLQEVTVLLSSPATPIPTSTPTSPPTNTPTSRPTSPPDTTDTPTPQEETPLPTTTPLAEDTPASGATGDDDTGTSAEPSPESVVTQQAESETTSVPTNGTLPTIVTENPAPPATPVTPADTNGRGG